MKKNIVYIDLPSHQEPFEKNIQNKLDQLNRQIGTELSLAETMDVVWSETHSLLPHDRIGLSLIDADKQRVSAYYFKTKYPQNQVHLGADFSTGLANSTLEHILTRGCSRIINDLPLYLKQNPHSSSTKLLVAEGVHSSLTLPLQVNNRPVGFIFFSSRSSYIFTIKHARILAAILEILSQQIEKVWYIKQLQDRQEDYLTMLGFVSHEMKSPLATMMSIGQTYLKGYMGTVDPLADQTIKKMLRISGYMVNMINNYLDLSRLETGEMKFSPKPGINFVDDILNFALESVKVRAEERGSHIKLAGHNQTIILNADSDLLRIMAVNLIDNAVKYGEENSQINIKIEAKQGELVFAVKNQGIGFSEEQGQKLFKRFNRLKQKGLEDRRGTGLGLYITWWIIQQHQGRIEAKSEPGQWAEFIVTLPMK